ncbi:UNVERIFIED_CONTAM: hypothetical protein GTU68_001743 [Idotea baltica]|nr:hypothetical protein [Idotea baltica]
MARKYNFSAGPATLSLDVLEQAQKDLVDWQGCGMSVMEMSHRGAEFASIAEKATNDLKEILNVPDNYKILFLQGGASSQFSAVPLNLLKGKNKADYFCTGTWSKKAIAEAKKYCEVNIVASSEDTSFTTIPSKDTWNFSDDAAYVHYTPNETIQGVEFHDIPDVGDKPLVADFSSTILSRPIDVSKFGVIYAGAQKNIGPAGVTIVIVREDLLGDADPKTPAMLDYEIMASKDSMYNTPPCFAWYMAGLTFAWIKDQGGLEAMSKHNKDKSDKLYTCIEESSFYASPVAKDCRSWMNVPFTLANSDLDSKFLEEASEAGLVTLKGHRSVGGMRASIYNAMPAEGIDKLIGFMKDFEQKNA